MQEIKRLSKRKQGEIRSDVLSLGEEPVNRQATVNQRNENNLSDWGRRFVRQFISPCRSSLPTLLVLLILSIPGQAVAEGSVTDAPTKYSAGLSFMSAGHRLPAIFYGAAGEGPHPTVILLHGYPGNEKNLDVAQGLRDAGWNVLFFHYRGAWGAEGDFSFLNSEADVQAAIEFLGDARRAKELRIAPGLISLVGHSMGGHLAIAGIQQNPTVRCAVAYDGANLGMTFTSGGAEDAANWTAYSDTLFMLEGWSGARFMAELKANAEHLNLLNHVEAIGERSVLMVAADSDVISIGRIQALTRAIEEVGGNVAYVLIRDDHSFNNHRQELLDVTREFLNENCR